MLSGDPNLPLWYKDAVIYELHVKAFYDANGDGTGDFAGLSAKLDYLQELGVTALWLLPFYPSPLRDDGYDVADYCGVHERYGTLEDVRVFIDEAHRRGLRVITEFVVNHTSDQHPWFKRARRAPRGSAERDFYVWSDDDRAFAGTRIIFTDSENSNWTWDPVAGQYYWHRFFHHQPDLNLENPLVFDELANVMRFWFRLGVDGMRLDALPYLCEREGTSNENLPETHAVVKRFRRILDEEFPDRFFLAEVNQWPEDVRAYFGDGDECHMAFHFPLMPRLFLAAATEDRYPVYDIMRQTPEIPATCQWALFLRNHDEMTLEMVTDRERAFMYDVYAPDARARLNVGIRRRLRPLLDNDRRKIELLSSMLLSLPGTPVLYYGDEIGMGDNIHLGDRDGVRTPMQWSTDRNGGFSRADSSALYLPVIDDPTYGYAAINVEAQQRNPTSFYHWMRRTIAVRRAHPVFGRGRIRWLSPANRHAMAYVREDEHEAILCVANLAGTAQAVELDLSRYAGAAPVEMTGMSAFPKIEQGAYVVTLPPFGFFWFALVSEPPAEPAASAPELVTLVLPSGWASVETGPARATLEHEILGPMFAGAEVHVRDTAVLDAEGATCLVLASVHEGDRTSDRLLALERSGDGDAIAPSAAPARSVVARARTGAREALVYDALAGDGVWTRLLELMRMRTALAGRYGTFAFDSTWSLDELHTVSAPLARHVPTRHSTTVVLDGKILLKLFHVAECGDDLTVEISQRLHDVNFISAPPLLGTIRYRPERGDACGLGFAYRYVEGRGTAWEVTQHFLARILMRRAAGSRPANHSAADEFAYFVRYAQILGNRLAEFHAALADASTSGPFARERFAPGDAERFVSSLDVRIERAPAILKRLGYRAPAGLAAAIRARLEALAPSLDGSARSRVHGRYTLDAVLVSASDVVIIDLDGDRRETIEQRRSKRSPLLDVATMLASFDAAAIAAVAAVGADRTDDVRRLVPIAEGWRQRASAAFLAGYEASAGVPVADAALSIFRVERALWEIDRAGDRRSAVIDAAARICTRFVEPEGAVPR